MFIPLQLIWPEDNIQTIDTTNTIRRKILVKRNNIFEKYDLHNFPILTENIFNP